MAEAYKKINRELILTTQEYKKNLTLLQQEIIFLNKILMEEREKGILLKVHFVNILISGFKDSVKAIDPDNKLLEVLKTVESFNQHDVTPPLRVDFAKSRRSFDNQSVIERTINAVSSPIHNQSRNVKSKNVPQNVQVHHGQSRQQDAKKTNPTIIIQNCSVASENDNTHQRFNPTKENHNCLSPINSKSRKSKSPRLSRPTSLLKGTEFNDNTINENTSGKHIQKTNNGVKKDSNIIEPEVLEDEVSAGTDNESQNMDLDPDKDIFTIMEESSQDANRHITLRSKRTRESEVTDGTLQNIRNACETLSDSTLKHMLDAPCSTPNNGKYSNNDTKFTLRKSKRVLGIASSNQEFQLNSNECTIDIAENIINENNSTFVRKSARIEKKQIKHNNLEPSSPSFDEFNSHSRPKRANSCKISLAEPNLRSKLRNESSKRKKVKRDK